MLVSLLFPCSVALKTHQIASGRYHASCHVTARGIVGRKSATELLSTPRGAGQREQLPSRRHEGPKNRSAELAKFLLRDLSDAGTGGNSGSDAQSVTRQTGSAAVVPVPGAYAARTAESQP